MAFWSNESFSTSVLPSGSGAMRISARNAVIRCAGCLSVFTRAIRRGATTASGQFESARIPAECCWALRLSMAAVTVLNALAPPTRPKTDSTIAATHPFHRIQDRIRFLVRILDPGTDEHDSLFGCPVRHAGLLAASPRHVWVHPIPPVQPWMPS